MIELKNITKVYDTNEGEFKALDNVSLTVNDGDVFGIIGESGAGKSTLVRHINLLEHPTSGQVIIDGVDVTGYKGKQLRELRAGIGMIFQGFSLYQQRTVLQNVMFPLELQHVSKAEAKKRAEELLEIVGLADKTTRYPSELSGGQQQRVAIARALANRPKIMLCDEATSALDSRTTVQILNLLDDINKRLGVTIVLITHSMSVARQACKHIAVLDHGHVVEQGETEAVFSNPQSEAAQAILAHHEGRETDAEKGQVI